MTLKILSPNTTNMFIWLNAAIMLYGVLLLDWQPETVIIAYFLETIIIGIIHIFKLFIVLKLSDAQQLVKPNPKNKLFESIMVVPFFIFHYFFFIFVQSVFVFEIIEDALPKNSDSFNVFKNYAYLLSQHDILLVFLTLAFSNTALTLKNFIFSGQYRTTTVSKIFFSPYIRIFIQQFATLISWFFLLMISSALASAILIVVLRLLVDLVLQAASTDETIKAQLISRLKKGQKPEDAAKTEESFESFL